MPRAYRRPYLFIIGMTVFFLLIYILLYTDLSGSRLSSSPQENLDLQLSPDLLGLGVLQQPHGPGVVAGLSSKRVRSISCSNKAVGLGTQKDSMIIFRNVYVYLWLSM